MDKFCNLDTVETAKILIDHGADVNAEVWHKWTPLHLATIEGF